MSPEQLIVETAHRNGHTVTEDEVRSGFQEVVHAVKARFDVAVTWRVDPKRPAILVEVRGSEKAAGRVMDDAFFYGLVVHLRVPVIVQPVGYRSVWELLAEEDEAA